MSDNNIFNESSDIVDTLDIAYVDLNHDIIKNFAKALNYSEKEISNVVKEKSKCDRETQDILHYIELETIEPYTAFILVLKLKEIRQRRRKADDLRKVMEPYTSFVKNRKDLNMSLFKLLKTVNEIEDSLVNRTYEVREREDLIFSPSSIGESNARYGDD